MKPRKPKAGQHTVADHPLLAAEWDHESNGGYTPGDVSEGSAYAAGLICTKRHHKWKSSVLSRTRMGSGCPLCNGGATQATGLASLGGNPKWKDVVAEWDHAANANEKAGDGSPLVPNNTPEHSDKVLGWTHPNPKGGDDCKWKQSVDSRTSRGHGCPDCNRPGPRGPHHPETNMQAFLDNYPRVAPKWHPKNALGPENFKPSSSDFAWFLCPEITCDANHSHEWEGRIHRVVEALRHRNSNGCHVCARRKHCLCNSIMGEKYEAVGKEFHPTKNVITNSEGFFTRMLRAEEVPFSSGTKRWWKCSMSTCGHEWEASPNQRTAINNPTGCPKCYVSRRWNR